MRRWHEQRDVVQPVFVESPAQRQKNFSGGGVGHAEDHAGARIGRGMRQPEQQHRPCDDADGVLAPDGNMLVNQQADHDQRDDGPRRCRRMVRGGAVGGNVARDENGPQCGNC